MTMLLSDLSKIRQFGNQDLSEDILIPKLIHVP